MPSTLTIYLEVRLDCNTDGPDWDHAAAALRRRIRRGTTLWVDGHALTVAKVTIDTAEEDGQA
jgi:hypothetical protein